MNDLNNDHVAEQQQGQMRLYCAGGAGIGIGKYFEAERGKNNAGYAALYPVYMDTSKASNFGVPDEYFYKLSEKDGSGGVRSEHGSEIIRHTKEIMQRFPAMDINIVISSTTGGSGSVMGPSIVSELLEQDKPVIVFHVGGDDSLQYINNTINTLVGYEKMADLRERPVVLQYLQNGVDGTVEDVDLKIHMAISCLTVLYSRQNKNLDSRDLYNWLNFSRKGVTTFGPQVAVLTICQKQLEIGDRALISLATLAEDLNNTRVQQMTEFQRVGVPMNLDKEDRTLSFPLHFAVTDGFVDVVMRGLRKTKKAFEDQAAARVVKNKVADGNEKVQSNGLVFD